MPTRINYQLKRSWKAKNLRISIHPNAKIVVTMPYLMRQKTAHDFVNKKSTWIFKNLKKLKKQQLLPKGNFLAEKRKAEFLIKSFIEKYNQNSRFNINRITIKNNKSRWGSCSKKKNLNFHYKIVFLPEDLINYIVVHELCHLEELNHSPKFWGLVKEFLPNYKELRKRLKKLH